MSTLSVWSFPATEGATSGLRLLERLQNRGRIRIGDSAIATWPAEDRRPTAYQVGTASGEALLSGAFWGLLFSVLFLAPLAGLTGPPWPHAGLRRIGLTDGWLELVRGRTVPGTSALFVLGADADLDRIRDALPTDLPPACCLLGADEESALQHAFGTH